jgi:RNA polymerase sigma-70 factor, ECF subfamily
MEKSMERYFAKEDNELLPHQAYRDDTRCSSERVYDGPPSDLNRQNGECRSARFKDRAMHDEIIGTVPRLRGFAMSLCRNPDRADDLVQETLLRALSHIDQFRPGTSLPAWLITILQNLFRSEYRRRRREVEDEDGYYANSQMIEPSQAYGLQAEEFPDALARLPANQREALALVVISELPYERVAEICRCPVGTVKSRVNRARLRLSELLEIDEVDIHLWKLRSREARRRLKQGKARKRRLAQA